MIATLAITFIVEILLLFTKTSKLLFHILGSIKYYQLKDSDGRPILVIISFLPTIGLYCTTNAWTYHNPIPPHSWQCFFLFPCKVWENFVSLV